jgi:hypothetical protein
MLPSLDRFAVCRRLRDRGDVPIIMVTARDDRKFDILSTNAAEWAFTMTTPQTGADQIAVRATLFADLRRFLPRGHEGPQSYTLPAGATVTDLLAVIGIPTDGEITTGRNGEQAQLDTVLHDGDDLVFFSPMEGGCGD